MQKRIMKDAQDLRLRPIIEGTAEPIDEDLYHWHGNIVVPLKIKDNTDKPKQSEKIVMHFHIELPK